MVSTRNHPVSFPPPDLSPTKRSRATVSPEPQKHQEPVVVISATSEMPDKATNATRSSARAYPGWSHTVSNGVLAWMVVSLPLVIWDIAYCLGRPHTMPNGKWQALWGPYKHYVTIDYLYGFEALANFDGFTGAQSAMNVVETLMFAGYVVFALQNGIKTGNGLERRVLGRKAGVAALLGFTAFTMTLAKTILYVLVTYYSGWRTLRDNDWFKIITLWIIPNGAWIVFPSIFAFVYGTEILSGLEKASDVPEKKLE